MHSFVIDPSFLSRKGIIAILHEMGQKECTVTESETLTDLTYEPESYYFINAAELIETDRIKLVKCLEKIRHKGLLITTAQDTAFVKLAMDMGVKIIISTHDSEQDLRLAVQHLMNNARYYSSEILDAVFYEVNQQEEVDSGLSKREFEILQMIARGHSSKNIAEQLFLSVHTVNSHRKNILKKTGVKSPAALIVYAMENGIV